MKISEIILREGLSAAKKDYPDLWQTAEGPELAAGDPSGSKGKYIEWMCLIYSKIKQQGADVAPSQHISDIVETVQTFDDLLKKNLIPIEKRDIKSYRTLNDLKTTNQEAQKEKESSVISKLGPIHQEDLVFRNNRAIVLWPKEYKRSCQYTKGGAEAVWCTGNPSAGDAHYKGYTQRDRGALYYIIPLVGITSDIDITGIQNGENKYKKMALIVSPMGRWYELRDIGNGDIPRPKMEQIMGLLRIPIKIFKPNTPGGVPLPSWVSELEKLGGWTEVLGTGQQVYKILPARLHRAYGNGDNFYRSPNSQYFISVPYSNQSQRIIYDKEGNQKGTLDTPVPEKDIAEQVDHLLSEMPWVTVGDKVIDLEFEKLRDKPAIMARIKSEVDKMPDKWEKIDFINTLFSDFWTMMNHYDIHKDEVQALVPEEPEEIYEDNDKDRL